MKLIIGLGNPGEKYGLNRHNVGFMAADEIARGYSFGPWKKRFQGQVAEGQIGTQKCILVKPGTYMNESGRAAGEAMRFYKLSVGDVIVIHDELDLKPGTIRVKTGGGNAGHNGLKSISAHIGNEYARVRIGIGHPGDKALVTDYVLRDFSKADRAWLDPLLQSVASGMERLVEGSEAAFLSEAARGRSQFAPAAKQNGAGRAGKADVKVADARAEIDQLQVILAAASKPIEPMILPSIPVAARDGGAAVVSRPVIMETPQPVAQQISEEPLPEAPGADMVEPPAFQSVEPAKVVEPLAEAPAIAGAANDISEPRTADAVAIPEDSAEPAEAAEARLEPAVAQKGFGTMVKSWFSSRVRGGVTTH
jgi:PTH1 family peptidyl-tRNA hydrolase